MPDPTHFHLAELWQQLIWPLIRLMCFISIGLVAANLIESLNWTNRLGAIARPLVRAGHLSEQVGAAFSVAIISGIAANTMLSESYSKQQLTKKELVLANLFNSLPTYFLHLPTMFFITLPLIKGAAFIYLGITFSAAICRTLSIVVIGRILLPRPSSPVDIRFEQPAPREIGAILRKTWRRFRKRIKKIALFTVPIYIAIFIMNRLAFFSYLEAQVASHLDFLPWLSPQAIGIITLHMAAELTAGIAAAGALLQDGVLSYQEIIFALIIGNVLSSPLRAFRHQFPYYAGIFKPALALELIIYNQAFRILSLIVVAGVYFWFFPVIPGD